MRNLTRFLWLGIARLMGKKTPKGRQYYILSVIALPKTPVHKLNLRVSKSPASFVFPSLVIICALVQIRMIAARPLSGRRIQSRLVRLSRRRNQFNLRDKRDAERRAARGSRYET